MKTFLKYTILLVLATGLFGETTKPQAYSDRILVCLTPDAVIDEVDNSGKSPITGLASLDQLLGSREIVKMEKWLPSATPDDRDGDIILSNIYRVTLGPKQPQKYIMTEIESDRNILFAEPEAINRASYIPNDELYGNQWHMPKVGAPEAWDFWDIAGGEIPGNRSVVLASVDSGVDITHPDLWENIWVNQNEIPLSIRIDVDQNKDFKITTSEILAYISDYDGDGVTTLLDALHPDSPLTDGEDNDMSTSQYADDLLGWDAAGVTTDFDPDNNPMPIERESHGTHVAGILAATSDNEEGVASVMYDGLIMPVKIALDSDGSLFDTYEGVLYAAKAGADIINCSWGSESYSAGAQSIVNVVTNTYEAIVVASAGNGNDDGTPSERAHYPSAYENVISVTAVGPQDNFAWAHYGADAGDGRNYGVDISAPGEGILSTIQPDVLNSYAGWNGTSMSSPLVASCIGLLKAANPGKSNEWLIDTILETTDPIDHLNPNYAGKLGTGRVNIARALARDKFPSLVYAGQILDVTDTDGDGRLSPGEQATLTIDLSNEPEWGPAEGVSAVLRSSSDAVTILDSVATFPDITESTTQSNALDLFTIQLNADAPSANFTFTLQVNSNDGQAYPYEQEFEFTIENIRWQAGFPVESASIKGGSAVVDLDGDGKQEIIYVAADSMLHVVKSDGTTQPGFPVKFGHKAEASPAVGDLDGDGYLEIVVGSWDRNVYVVQHDGSSEAIYQASNIILAPPALYDLDNDGDLEIVVLSYSKQIIAMHHDGALLMNYPVDVTGFLKVGPAIGDINADGAPDIVVTTLDKKLHALNADGTDHAGFPVTISQPIESAPVLANIDGDAQGTLEILFGSDANAFHAYDASGTELWQTSVGGKVKTDPAVADFGGDGNLEVVFGASDKGIYALNHDGSIVNGWPVYAEGVLSGSPVIADLDKDGSAEVFMGATDHWLYGLNGDGSNYFGFPLQTYDQIKTTATIADLDHDNDVELVIGTGADLAVTDLTSRATVINYWPTHRGNLRRTGTPTTMIPVGVEPAEQLPAEFALHGNYPNPFNPSTQIKFDLAREGRVKLEIIDIRGRLRETLVDSRMEQGSYSIPWNATFAGAPAEAGIYFYRLTTPVGSLVRKMTLLK